MQHLAFLNKKWELLPKILKGQKRIESRWYQSKRAPWDRIFPGETVYFKNSGESVSAKAEVDRVLQFEDLDQGRVRQLLERYGKGLALDDVQNSWQFCKDKRYCILIFLKNPREIEPFNIDKTGFGLMSAWISIDDINKIKK